MKKILLIAATFAALTACNKSVLDTTVTEAGFGHISLGVEANEQMVVTKGVTSSSSLEGYNIGLFDQTGTVPQWTSLPAGGTVTNGFIEYEDAIKPENAKIWTVKAATYTIKVENKTTGEVYPLSQVGEMRLAGDTTVVVTSGATANATVKCNVVNSKISFATSTNFNAIFTEPTVSVTLDNRTVKATTIGSNGEHTTATQIFFEPTTVTWNLDATFKSAKQSYTGTVTLKKREWSKVTFTTSTTAEDGKIMLNIIVNDKMVEQVPVEVDIDPFNPAQPAA